MKSVDLLITNEEDPKAVFGITAEGQDKNFKTVSVDAYRSIIDQLQKKYGVTSVAITLRESTSVWKNTALS